MLLKDYYNNQPSSGSNKNEGKEKTGQLEPANTSSASAPAPVSAPGPAPVASPNGGEQIMAVTPTIADAYGSKDNSMVSANPVVDRLNKGQDLYSALLDSRYKGNKEDLQRKQKAELIGNIAQLFGQSVSLANGARQFAPIKSKVPMYNDKLEQLKQWKDGIDINLTLNQARQDAEDKRYQAKIAWEKEKMKADQANKDKDFAIRIADLDRKVKEGKLRADQALQKLEEAKRHNKAQEGIGWTNAKANTTRAEKVVGGVGSSKQEMSVVVTGADGKRKTVMIPKDKSGAVISLYNRMKDIVEQKNATRSKEDQIDLDDINLQFGEGGDQATKALTIIQRRLPEFPELTDEFYQLVGVEKPKPAQRGSLLPGANNQKKNNSLLPK